MLYEVINDTIKLFVSNILSFSSIKYQLNRNKKKLKTILTTVSAKVFIQIKDYPEQVTTGYSIV